MGAISEIIEQPLTPEQLAARYRELCDDPRFANLQGKIELDHWGQIRMSPANNFQGVLQMRLGQRMAALGGQAIAEAVVQTRAGISVADVAWASAAFMQAHGTETPFTQAPELCIEIASPSNSRKALREKMDACLAAGAKEVWIVFPQTKRFEFYDATGLVPQTSFNLDLDRLFD